jgi:hypothetical protein
LNLADTVTEFFEPTSGFRWANVDEEKRAVGIGHGRYLPILGANQSDTRMSHVFLSILRSLQIDAPAIADSTGVLHDSIFSAV